MVIPDEAEPGNELDLRVRFWPTSIKDLFGLLDLDFKCSSALKMMSQIYLEPRVKPAIRPTGHDGRNLCHPIMPTYAWATVFRSLGPAGSISWRYRAAHWRRGCVPLKPGALHLSNTVTCQHLSLSQQSHFICKCRQAPRENPIQATAMMGARQSDAPKSECILTAPDPR